MKQSILVFSAIFLILSCSLLGQTTVTLQASMDAAIGFHDGAGTANNNYGGAIQNAAFTIPATASLGGVNTNRALIDFNLSIIPANATLISANINLYALGPYGSLSGHVGANSSYLQRINQSWSEYVATWNNQPTSLTLNQVILNQSTSSTQDYLNINVTPLVQDMLNNPATSFGFKLGLVNESVTNVLLFASRDHSNPALRPNLVVTYSICSAITVSVSPPQTICSGNQANIQASGSGTNVLWYASPTASTSIAGGSVYSTAVLTATTSPQVYTYYASAVGCTVNPRVPVNVTVNPPPNVTAVSSPSAICVGSSITLTGTGAQTYTWTQNQVVIGTSSIVVLAPPSNGTFVLNGKDANNCTGSSTLTVKVLIPNITAVSTRSSVCLGESITLAGTGALTYTWTRNQVVIGTSSTMTFVPPTTSTIVLNGKDANNCVGNSTLTVNVMECTGIRELVGEVPLFVAFPNPVNDVLTLKFSETVRAGDVILFSDLSGKVLQKYTLFDAADNTVNVKIDLEEGMYFCTLMSDGTAIDSHKISVKR
ncbi:MAG: DNRLRE domain-containing protein [bacterium]|nr:DNRLRE domain-containing protein [bacterium]